MADVINLNRFRKKKAKIEKEKRAETNRRLHGRTQAERTLEDAQKKRIEDQLDGAFLVRESVRMEDIPTGEGSDDYARLQAATDHVPTLGDLSQKLKQTRADVEKEDSSDRPLDDPQ